MKKRLLGIIISMIMCLSSVAIPAVSVSAADEVVPVYLDGNAIKFDSNDAQPQIISNRTYVPIRATCDALGLSIDWNKKTETLTFTRDDIVISHTMRSDTVYVNGEAKSYDTKSINKNDRTLMPIRMLADAIGADVEWNDTTKSVHITTTGSSSSSSDAAINSITSGSSTATNGDKITITVIATGSTDKVKFTDASTGETLDEVNEYNTESDGTRKFETKVTCSNEDSDEYTLTINAAPGTNTGGYLEDEDSIKSVDIKVSEDGASDDDDEDSDDDEDEDLDEETVVKSFESEHFVKLIYTSTVKKNGYVKFEATTDDEIKRVKVSSTAADDDVIIKEYDEDGDDRVFEGKIKLTSTGTQKIKIDLYGSDGYEEIEEAFSVKVTSSSSSSSSDDGIIDVEVVNDAFYVSVGSPIYVTTSTNIDYIEVISEDDDRVCGKTSFTTSKTSTEKLWTVDVTVSETGRNQYVVTAYEEDSAVDEYSVTLNGKKFNKSEPLVLSMEQKSATIKAGDEARFTAKVTGCVTRVDIRKESGGSTIGTGESSSSSSSTKNMTVSFETNNFDDYYVAYAYDSSGSSSTYTFKITGDVYEQIEITDIEIEDDTVEFGDAVTLTVYTTNSCEKLWVEDSRGQRVSRTLTSPDDEDGNEYIWELDFSPIDDDYKSSRTFTVIAQDEDKETSEKSIQIHFTK